MADMEKASQRERHALADGFEREMGHLVDALTSSADSLEVAATAAEDVEQTTATASSIAQNSEELSTSIFEISRQGDFSTDAVTSMAIDIQNAQKAVAELEEAAASVDRVIVFIRGIAGQTNLLALNATIEAARAGEAGRAGPGLCRRGGGSEGACQPISKRYPGNRKPDRRNAAGDTINSRVNHCHFTASTGFVRRNHSHYQGCR